jgi:hypothetical protein
MREREAGIRDEVIRRMTSFEAAERSLDSSSLIAHFSTAGDVCVHNDGQRVDLKTITAGACR